MESIMQIFTKRKRVALLMALTMLMFGVVSYAQTSVTLPAACANCTSGSTNGTAVVSNYGNSTCANPSAGTINGTLTQGVAASGVTMTLYANVTQIGSWNITTIASNGVTFSGSGTFTSLGCQPITLTASGTPTTAGPLTVNTNTSPVGTASTTVAPSTDPSSNGSAVVSAYGGIGCTGNGIMNGTYTVGQAVTSGNTLTFYANVTQIGTWNITTAANNGVTFSGSGTFTSTGCQAITLTASGTPTSAGTLIAVTNTSPTGTASATVSDPSSNGTASVSNYGNSSCANPSTGTINGNLTQGVPVSGVTMTLYANVTQVGSWSLSAVQNGVTFTGSGTFTSTGCQPITLTASGTPTATGSFTWTTNSSPQGSSPGTVSAKAPTNPIGAGSFSGKACFDVAISNDNVNGCGTLSSRLAQKSDFTQASTNTQTYTFTPSGTVSNVRFVFVNTNGTAITALTGGNTGNNINSPVTATVTYASTLNTPATGLTNSNPITSDIYVVYNNSANNTGSDVQIKLTASIKDCACCGAFIAAGVWKDFLCHNLGANTTVDPHVPAVGIHGAHIQWGKRGPNTTGDSRVDWQTAANNGAIGFGAAPTPGNDNTVTIAGWSTTPAVDYSWRTTAGAKTANDPCPSGYRVPTSAEWSGVTINNTISRSGTWGSVNTNYSSAIHFGPNASTKLLTLPAAGIRSIAGNNGAFGSRGSNGYYWSSNEGANSGPALLFAFISTDQYPLFTSDRLYGMSIRCIEDSDYVPVVPAASVGALNCSGATTTGTLRANTLASGVSTSVPYTSGNYGTYTGQAISSTGITGLTATLSAGTLDGGSSNVSYIISGTPSGSGTANFAISLGGQSCTLGVSVAASAPTNPTGTGSLSGKTCFDVALSNDNTNSCGALSARLAQQANFTQAATNTQIYTFTPSGIVSNVRFVYVNTNGAAITALTGGNTGNNISSPVTATVTYANTLNTPATGLTNSNPITSDIYVVYNNSANNTGSDVQIKLTANIKDCSCCGAYIAAGVWKEFLCHNLGANTSLDPHTPVVGLQGAYIQWGSRGPNTTGDSRVDWQTAANNAALGFAAAPTILDAKAGAIAGWNSSTSTTDYSWYSVSGVKTANDPCPTGYRVPTSAEWTGVSANNTISRTGTYATGNTEYGSALHYGPNASAKLLTLPSAGYHDVNGGSLAARGGDGYYWGSTGNGGSTNAYAHRANSQSLFPAYNYPRGYGFSIRCIAE